MYAKGDPLLTNCPAKLILKEPRKGRAYETGVMSQIGDEPERISTNALSITNKEDFGADRGPRMSVERLFTSERYHENEEMYVKAIWRLKESGESPARVASVSKLLNVKPPSVVGMLKKLDSKGFTRSLGRRGTSLTSTGRRHALRLIRNCRLVEVFMRDAMGIPVDEKLACHIEHRLSDEFADGLCRMLHHPASCPHGQPIPRGRCCRATGVL